MRGLGRNFDLESLLSSQIISDSPSCESPPALIGLNFEAANKSLHEQSLFHSTDDDEQNSLTLNNINFEEDSSSEGLMDFPELPPVKDSSSDDDLLEQDDETLSEPTVREKFPAEGDKKISTNVDILLDDSSSLTTIMPSPPGEITCLFQGAIHRQLDILNGCVCGHSSPKSKLYPET